MNEIEISARTPLTPAGLSRALVDAARAAQIKRKATPSMSQEKAQQHALYCEILSDWFRFVQANTSPLSIGSTAVEVSIRPSARQALVEMTFLNVPKESRRRFIAAALACKNAERRWLTNLDRLTERWKTEMDQDIASTVEYLDRTFLHYTGGSAVKVVRHSYGSATNTYWGLVAVADKLSIARFNNVPTGECQHSLSMGARQLALVFASLHIGHLREVDLTLRGNMPSMDYQAHLFAIDHGTLCVRQSPALLKAPEVGSSIATGCPAASATVATGGSVASNLMRMFEQSYLSMPDRK